MNNLFKWIGTVIGMIIGLVISGIIKGYFESESMGLLGWATTGGIIGIIIPWLFLEADPRTSKGVNIETGQICCAISCAILFAISGWTATGIWGIILGVFIGGVSGYVFGWIPSRILGMISTRIDYNGSIVSLINMAIGSAIIYGLMSSGNQYLQLTEQGKVETLLFPIKFILIFAFLGSIGCKYLGISFAENKINKHNLERQSIEKKKLELLDFIEEIITENGNEVKKKEIFQGGLKMCDEEKLNNIKNEVQDAINLINENHPGANPDDAKRYLSEAGRALKENKYDEAIALAKNAKLSAKPSTDYLFLKAKELDALANKSYSSKNYVEAIHQWKKALETYYRAKERAGGRNEKEVIEKIVNNEGKIDESISNAEISIDHQMMRDLVASGKKAFEKADKLFETKEFEESKDAYEIAKKAFKEALAIAEKRSFTVDKATIEDGLKSVEASIESALLKKGNAMLQEARENFEKKKFADAEKDFSLALKYFNDINISRKKDLEDMKVGGREGFIKAKLEQGKEKMHDSDKFFMDNKYYDAKEGYRGAMGYLGEVLEEASRFKLTKLVEELKTFINACNQNYIKAADPPDPDEKIKSEIIPVDKIKPGMAVFIPEKKQSYPTVPIFTFPPELQDEYSNAENFDEGGNSWIYRATRKSDGLTVAVKIPKQFDRKTGRLFLDEITNWRNLSHKNIVKIFDYNASPRLYIAMEFLETSLEKLPKPMDPKKAAYIIFKVADGLNYAHKKHILHNDLKPSNILFGNDEEPKIADWGMSRAIKSSTFTPGLARGGTPLYASPEQIKDEKVDERTDIWQLGSIFYECITGKPPFYAEYGVAVTRKILEEEPTPLTQKSQITANKIIMKCLKKQKEDRYQDMKELQYDLAEMLDIEFNETMKITPARLAHVKLCTDLIDIHAPATNRSGDKVKCEMYLNGLHNIIKNSETKKKIQDVIYFSAHNFNDIMIRDKIDEIIHDARMKA
ncbi:MAG: protein kinase [Euryarchaeota archaeon]|nr:protein kinase [Euryarchaeota archaeon]MCG2736442.1 protein kinase [Candidatus Methanoperedenaceae archaeon]